MKKHLLRMGCTALSLLLFAAALTLPAVGVGEDAPHSIGFVTSAILPNNQRTGVGYFDLVTPPSTTQTLYVEVTNKMRIPLTFEVLVGDAHSNPHGVISYAPQTDALLPVDAVSPAMESAVRLSAIAQLQLEELLNKQHTQILEIVDNQVTIAPYATVFIPITLNLPETPLEGQVLGGVVVTRIDTTAKDISFGVHSVYSYAIAIQLQSEAEVSVQPSFALQSVQLTKLGGFPALAVYIVNNAPMVVAGAQLHMQIMAPGQDIPLVEIQQERVSMAPLSVMPFSALLPDGQLLPAGQYQLKVDWNYAGQSFQMEAGLSVS